MEEMKTKIFQRLEQAHRQFHSLEVLIIVGAAVHPEITAGIALADYAGHVAWAVIHPQPHDHENKTAEKVEQARSDKQESLEQQSADHERKQVQKQQFTQSIQ